MTSWFFKNLRLHPDLWASVQARATSMQLTPHALILLAIKTFLEDGRRKR